MRLDRHVMLNEIDVLRDIASKFAQGNIDYMLTGSMAMNYYAEPRMTRDIDVVVALDSKDIDTIAGLFGPDYYLARESIARAVTRESVFNLVHNQTIILNQWTRELGLYDLWQECLHE